MNRVRVTQGIPFVSPCDMQRRVKYCDEFIEVARRAGRKLAQEAHEHVKIAAGWCAGVCAGVEYQGGTLSFTVGVDPVPGFGVSATYNSHPSAEQGPVSVGECYSRGVGGCITAGQRVDGNGHWNPGDRDGYAGSAGITFGSGSMRPVESYTAASYDFTTGKFTRFPDPFPLNPNRVNQCPVPLLMC